MSTRTESKTGPEEGAAGSRGRRGRDVGRIVLYGMLSLAACGAIGMILALVGAWGWSQSGPGGMLSDVKPGAMAPDFEAEFLEGGSVRLSDYRGRPVALNFWATWCPPCVHEMPMLREAERRYAAEGFAVLAMNAGQTVEHLEEFMPQFDLEGPVVLDPGRLVYGEYGVVGLPTTIWIDREGVIRAVEVGQLTPELIDRYVAQLLRAGEEAGRSGADDRG